ncbi:MAG: oxidoreductase [Microbacteriaceae bacterium]|nr:oxidoreductase [Microbacteriaceae bacterium]
MSIITEFPTPSEIYDCVVVGAGPIGLSLALEAATAGLRVLLLDAGNATGRENAQALAARPPATVLDPATHTTMELATRRGVGGASWLWGGRCVQFEPIDFEPRDYIDDGEWPLSLADVSPWEAAAASYLDCGVPTFRNTSADWAGLGEINLSQLERWARQPKLARRLGTQATNHPGITVLCEATVTDLDIDSAGTRVDNLVVLHQGRTVKVRARGYVLACGGLETTRLLLDVQRRLPDHFGGTDGPLGRYYLGHLTGSIANIQLTNAADIHDLDFQLDENNSYVRRRFTFSERTQREHRLLNTSFYADNPPFYEPGHRNSTLSLVFLALSFAPIGRRILSEGIRLRHIGPKPRRYGQHLMNIAKSPFRAATDVIDILRKRYLSPVRKPGFLLRNAGGTYALHFHAEQIPNPDSRVTLNATTGVTGQPGLDIDFRYTQQDHDSVLATHEYLDQQLRESGRGRLVYLDAEDERLAAVLAQATDGFHQIGTTRMSADEGDGVVDRDCRVHGVDNLFIASTSVFRTAGEANPTFLAVCLAVRLARHLAEAQSTSTAVDSAPVDPASADPASGDDDTRTFDTSQEPSAA